MRSFLRPVMRRKPSGIDLAEVAGAQPAAVEHLVRGRLGISVVAAEHVRSAHQHLAVGRRSSPRCRAAGGRRCRSGGAPGVFSVDAAHVSVMPYPSRIRTPQASKNSSTSRPIGAAPVSPRRSSPPNSSRTRASTSRSAMLAAGAQQRRGARAAALRGPGARAGRDRQLEDPPPQRRGVLRGGERAGVHLLEQPRHRREVRPAAPGPGRRAGASGRRSRTTASRLRRSRPSARPGRGSARAGGT